MRFHITEDGPKQCRAPVGKCPLSKNSETKHFGNFEEAQKSFENKMETEKGLVSGLRKDSRKRTFAPEKPNVEPVSLGEALEGLERVKEHFSKSKDRKAPYPEALRGELSAYTLTGSLIFNLHHPESDRDVHLFTDSTKGKDIHIVFPDDVDIRVSSLFNFSEQVMEGSPNLVDIWGSGEMSYISDSPYKPYMDALRFNRFTYVKKATEHARRDLHNSLGADKNTKRAEKHMKTALRQNVVLQKFLETGKISPRFSDSERETFYESYESLLTWINKNKEEYSNLDGDDKERKGLIVEKGEQEILRHTSKFIK